MRIQIKTKRFKKGETDLQMLNVIDFALKMTSKRMVMPTIEFFADKHGYRLIKK